MTLVPDKRGQELLGKHGKILQEDLGYETLLHSIKWLSLPTGINFSIDDKGRPVLGYRRHFTLLFQHNIRHSKACASFQSEFKKDWCARSLTQIKRRWVTFLGG